MKRTLSAALCLTFILMSTACTNSKKPAETKDTADITEETAETTGSSEATTTEETEATTEETTEAKKKHQPMSHEFQTFVYPQFFQVNFSEDTMKSFESFCNAVTNGETEFDCPNLETMGEISWIASDLMPIGEYYIGWGDDAISDGKATLSYAIPHDEYMQKLQEFKDITVGILDET